MGSLGRIALFLTIVLSIWTAFHAYAYGRIFALPVFSGTPLPFRVAIVAAFWLSYPVGRILVHTLPGLASAAVEFLGAIWMGVLFLLCAAFLAVDILTLFGRVLPSVIVPARLAAGVLAILFSVVAVIQNVRGPRVVEYEVQLPNLPADQDGLRVVQLSDLHLGTLLGEKWLSRRLEQVAALKPSVIFITGDLVDAEVAPVRPLIPMLQSLDAPLGVWAVTGNHEFYAGLAASVDLLTQAKFRVLRDSWAEVSPGLVLAGVDDLTARKNLGTNGSSIRKAFEGAPAGSARILLSHSPLEMEEARRQGAGLMLSGHTHGGQIWPFTYLAAIPYPHQAGRYQIGALTLLVSRGTGTWGPPMRLFARSEILAITLRRAGDKT